MFTRPGDQEGRDNVFGADKHRATRGDAFVSQASPRLVAFFRMCQSSWVRHKECNSGTALAGTLRHGLDDMCTLRPDFKTAGSYKERRRTRHKTTLAAQLQALGAIGAKGFESHQRFLSTKTIVCISWPRETHYALMVFGPGAPRVHCTPLATVRALKKRVRITSAENKKKKQ